MICQFAPKVTYAFSCVLQHALQEWFGKRAMTGTQKTTDNETWVTMNNLMEDILA